ncbi:3,4-dihydroxy-2-butanone-4-phosphate synthase [Ruania albidiflava]|uniref:3,4-dihydroxy-2-butanone-4-phosphate synthase n=1 Tax=Ruania albidiflava TaxID=366586 RepID=UPI0023F594E4|nr:3,4-dihydroxy-2-butanone-4-phosphate synthase [Ruania albidiflava]
MDQVSQAIAEIAAGRMVIVTDDPRREDEGDLVAAADAVAPETVAFMATHGRGLVCAPISSERATRLDLPPMTAQNTESHGTAFTVSVDAATGITTGISAADRARTVRLLTDPEAGPDDLARPGHVFPLVAHPAGVLGRAGHTEAGVDLARLAGRTPAAVICEMLTPDGVPYRGEQLRALARMHGLVRVSIAELIQYRKVSAGERGVPPSSTARTAQVLARAARVRRGAAATLPTTTGLFRVLPFTDEDGTEHLALCTGLGADERFAGEQDVLVRVHSECLTGDVLGSQRCDCGQQLTGAQAAVAEHGRGVVLYLRGHEGRGIGLAAKIHAYALQEQGRDTVQANLDQGLPVDAREYGTAAAILHDLGADRVRLISNNPAKAHALTSAGLTVQALVPAPAPVGPENLAYLRTKADRLGHLLPWLPAPSAPPVPEEGPR